MTGADCDEMRLLVQADLDGELTPAEAARVAAHVERCPACAAIQSDLMALSSSIRAQVTHHPAPASLQAAVARLAPAAVPTAAPLRGGRRGAWFGIGFAPGFALAACLALAFVLPGAHDGLADSVVAGHIRALQPGHLMDVVSTDQHTVKPWFDGRLIFAPPVVDLATDGFPLSGARLDYLDGREVAVLVYGARQHVVEVFVWPAAGSAAPAAGVRNGYNFVHWTSDGVTVWVVSDLNPAELAQFGKLWRAARR